MHKIIDLKVIRTPYRKTLPCRRLQEAGVDDLVGVHVLYRKRDSGGDYVDEFFHCLFLSLKSESKIQLT